jgi:hypothetical protein
MESWLSVTPLRRKATQRELIDDYATHPSGGLRPVSAGTTADRDFETLADDFSIEFAVMTGAALTASMVNEKLKHGHVLLVYNLSPGIAHANVVYGVGYPTGKERLISVMDPSETTRNPQTGLYRNRPVSFYKERRSRDRRLAGQD